VFVSFSKCCPERALAAWMAFFGVMKMAFVVPNEVDPENLDDRILPGRYQIYIQNVDDRGEKSIIVTYEVVAGTNADMVGKVGKEFLPSKSIKGVKRVVMFAIATGLTTQDIMIEERKAGKQNSFDLPKAKGKSIFVEIAKNGDYNSWTFNGIYPLNDPSMADIAQVAVKDIEDTGSEEVKKIPF